MKSDDLKETIVQVAELLEFFKRQSEEASRTSRDNAELLQQTVAAAPGIVRQAADSALSGLSNGASQALKVGIETPLQGFDRHILEMQNRLNTSSHAFVQAVKRIEVLEKRLLVVTVTVCLAMVLVVVASGGLLWYLRREVQSNLIQADLLRAYNSADVTLCGGRLCAKIDKESKPYGADGEYVPVAPRR